MIFDCPSQVLVANSLQAYALHLSFLKSNNSFLMKIKYKMSHKTDKQDKLYLRENISINIDKSQKTWRIKRVSKY